MYNNNCSLFLLPQRGPTPSRQSSASLWSHSLNVGVPAVAVENIFLWNRSESAFPFPREPQCSPPYFDFIWGWKERKWLRKTGGAGISNYLRPGSGHPVISLCYNCPSCRRIQISVGVSGIKRFIVRQEVRLATEIRGPCRDLSYIWIWDGPGCRPKHKGEQLLGCGSKYNTRPMNLFILQPQRFTHGFLILTQFYFFLSLVGIFNLNLFLNFLDWSSSSSRTGLKASHRSHSSASCLFSTSRSCLFWQCGRSDAQFLICQRL